MAEQQPFRYVHEVAGAFVLLAVALLVVGIILAGQAQGWFESKYDIYIRLPQEGSYGLRKGAEVQVLQTPVGKVDEITVGDDGTIEARLRIHGGFTHFVREDSVAVIRRKFTVAGDAYVDIRRGTGEPLSRDGAHLACRTDTDLVAQLQAMLDDVRFSVVETMDRLKALVEEHTALAAQLSRPEGPFQQVLAHVESIAAGLAAGEGTAGRLLRDPRVAEELEGVLASLNASLQEVTALLERLQATAAGLPALVGDVGEQFDEMPRLLRRAELTLRETERLVEGLQQHWLVRKYIAEKDGTAPLPVESLGTVSGAAP